MEAMEVSGRLRRCKTGSEILVRRELKHSSRRYVGDPRKGGAGGNEKGSVGFKTHSVGRLYKL